MIGYVFSIFYNHSLRRNGEKNIYIYNTTLVNNNFLHILSLTYVNIANILSESQREYSSMQINQKNTPD